MTIKACKEASYTPFKKEIEGIIREQDDFLIELYVWMQECEGLDEAEVTSFYIYSFETATPPKKTPDQC